jgi:hypothetical protein
MQGTGKGVITGQKCSRLEILNGSAEGAETPDGAAKTPSRRRLIHQKEAAIPSAARAILDSADQR